MVSLGDTVSSRGVFWVRSDLESRKKVRVFNFGGGGFLVRSDLDSGKNFVSRGRGGGVLEPNPRTPGCSGEVGQKFLEAELAGASQIVSHILRMWRLINSGNNTLHDYR